tara:strand:- start:500 stop:784 length:285 start_codon:yes stop_codon:yes gene_type:complete
MQFVDQNSISVFQTQKGRHFNIVIGNVKMRMGVCRFAHFKKYLSSIHRNIDFESDKIELTLVKNNLVIELDLDDFLRLFHEVSSIISNQDYLKN